MCALEAVDQVLESSVNVRTDVLIRRIDTLKAQVDRGNLFTKTVHFHGDGINTIAQSTVVDEAGAHGALAEGRSYGRCGNVRPRLSSLFLRSENG